MSGAPTTPAAARSMAFGDLTITYDDRVLTPRPWTEAQSRWAADLLLDEDVPHGPVLELCAGAGQIGLLAVALAPRRLVCVDLSPAAIELTLANAEANGLDRLVEVRHGRIDEVLADDEQFALVVADPPWVPRQDVGRFPEDPVVAIDGGPDGLDVAWTCLDAAAAHLAPGGSALLQLGTLEQVRAIEAGLADRPKHAALSVVEVRECERGVLVRLVRQP